MCYILFMTTAAHKPKRSTTKKVVESVGVRELRQSASQLLDQVKDGASIEITEHGVPIARLIPITQSLYEEYLESGRIIAARNPNRVFTMPSGKIAKGKQLSELLIEERRSARF
jgi:prevent-host-death family protein